MVPAEEKEAIDKLVNTVLNAPINDVVLNNNTLYSVDENRLIQGHTDSLKLGPIQNGFHKPVQLDMDADKVEHKCGYGSFTGKFLQKFHNIKCLLVTLIFCLITQGIVINGLIPVSITTLEKRFHLSSTESGFFASMYEIAVLLVLVPLCHFGGKGHKGRYLGWGMIIMGIGSFVCTLPQFATGPYNYGQHAPIDTCRLNKTDGPGNASGLCLAEESNVSGKPIERLRLYLYVLLLGQLFHGIGASPLYTLGITYIDENTSQRSSPVYLGLYIGFGTLGPALGFIFGGVLLQVYGDIGKVDLRTVHMEPGDARWYGAWWIGFVICGALAILFSLPMLSFARELPGSKEQRKKDVNQARRSSTDVVLTNAFEGNLHELRVSFLQLLKNPTFVGLIVMQCAEAFLLNGFVAFLPKLAEHLFSLPSSTASMITGAILVPLSVSGNILGGYLVQRFELLCKDSILLAFAFQAASAVLVLSILIRCPQQKILGITHPYIGEQFGKTTDHLIDICNGNCQCNNYYQPVCSTYENVSYFSACMAGCQVKHAVGNDVKSWKDCTCIQHRFPNLTRISPTSPNFTGFDSVVPGLCPMECPMKYLFFVLLAIQVILSVCSSMPIKQAELRCVPFELRTLAVGLTSIFARLLGAIPGLIGFGAAIDTACIFWEKKCGEGAACLRYDSRLMALIIMGFALGLKALILASLFFAWKFYKPPLNATKPESPAINGMKYDHARNKVYTSVTDETIKF